MVENKNPKAFFSIRLITERNKRESRNIYFITYHLQQEA